MHIINAAPILVLTLSQLELINTYVSDPAHIAPSRSDANSNGHFPPANGHVPAGTPRGFNLNSFNGMPPLPGFGNFFGGHAVQVPPGWSGGDGGAGPMRRGGRYTNQRSAGPYDRAGGRDQRFGGNGRMSPPPGGRNLPRTGGGRWGDGGAGGSATGPREAVQGRSLKSYEDLDDVGGSGAGELNY